MAPPTKKNMKQNELRKLMQERRSEIKSKGGKRIDSPLAKYNNFGQLTCIVCEMVIKNEALWSVHIAGKIHKEKLEVSKRKQIPKNSQNVHNIVGKRKDEDTSLELSEKTKKVKLDSVETKNKSPVVQKPEQITVRSEVSISSEYLSEEEEDEPSEPASKPTSLPEDFFDKPSVSSTSLPSNKVTKAESQKSNATNSLPEGFFDNPILDAKVRKVEYKDPVEEEWEKFQKAMAEETNVSQAIIEEDMQESNVEREITEIDEQIHHWSRVEALLEQKDNLMKGTSKNSRENDESNSADETEFEEFLDWRSKRVWKK